MADDFSALAQQLVQKIAALRRRYPEEFESMGELQETLLEDMREMKAQMKDLPTRESALLTLVVIKTIHREIDEVFHTPEEA